MQVAHAVAVRAYELTFFDIFHDSSKQREPFSVGWTSSKLVDVGIGFARNHQEGISGQI